MAYESSNLTVLWQSASKLQPWPLLSRGQMKWNWPGTAPAPGWRQTRRITVAVPGSTNSSSATRFVRVTGHVPPPDSCFLFHHCIARLNRAITLFSFLLATKTGLSTRLLCHGTAFAPQKGSQECMSKPCPCLSFVVHGPLWARRWLPLLGHGNCEPQQNPHLKH
jgi:hypothetical protein